MFSLQSFLPQGEAVSTLIRQLQENRMPHALMITGETGVGKWTLAQSLAAALLCEATPASLRPCGKCRSCEQMESLSHPDLTVLELGKPLVPTETKTSIPVTDVQEMIRRVSRQGYQGDRRVVLIHQAEHLNIPAQNKLLKTLEEPPEGTFFLLTTSNAEGLLPTIISRCPSLQLHPWKEEEVLRVLAEKGYTGEKAREAASAAAGSFGSALSIMGDEAYWQFRDQVVADFLSLQQRSQIPLISARWKDRKQDAALLFSMLENFFSRLARQSLIGAPPGECPSQWQAFAKRAGAEEYVKLLDALQLAQRRIGAQVNFQVALEQLLLTFMEAVSS